MIYYQKKGAGNEPLILLHSGAMTSSEWEPQFGLWDQQFKMYAPDLPGHGQSLTTNAVSIESMAQEVLWMMDENGLEKANILGSSMGGAIALWLAIYHSNRVKKLIVYRIGYQKNQAVYEQIKAMADPAYWQQYGLHRWLSQIHKPQGGDDAWKKVIANVSKIMDPSTDQDRHTLASLEKITHETLLIAGDRDPIIPLDTISQMHQHIQNSGLWIIPFASHVTSSNTWRSEAFAKEIARFILFKK